MDRIEKQMQGYSGSLHSTDAIKREIENCKLRLADPNTHDHERAEIETRLSVAQTALALPLTS